MKLPHLQLLYFFATFDEGKTTTWNSSNARVVIRTADIQAIGRKGGLQVVKNPIVSGKSANKKNGLYFL